MGITIQELVEIAQEVEVGDPIDWGMLRISEEDAYRMIAMSVLEQFDGTLEDERLMCLATITKLLVENMVLNLHLIGMDNRLKNAK